MNSLLRDPGKLRDRLHALLELRKRGELDINGVEALAECSFRLAVHPDTPGPEALDHLRRAARLDGANPKHAYHLARLYFIHGKFKHASDWLRLANRLCPTSHRIWAHVSLLQRELNQKYVGNKDFEPNALRKYGSEISEAIRDGEDYLDPALLRFEPPPSRDAQEARLTSKPEDEEQSSEQDDDTKKSSAPPRELRRLLNPKQCRWSGINDLLLEQALVPRADQERLRTLIPLLEKLADRARERENGTSAFAITSVQWLISGYPVDTVRRIRESLPQADGASLDLLDTVCSLFEVEEKKLPRAISEALKKEKIPPLLAALVHQRRLLWRPMEYLSYVAYRSARRLIAGAADTSPENEDARRAEIIRTTGYERKLARSASRLYPDPKPPLKDILPTEGEEEEEIDPQSADDELILLQASAKELTSLRNDSWDYLRNTLVGLAEKPVDDAAYSRAVAEWEAFGEITRSLEKAAKTRRRHLDRVVRAISKLGPENKPEGDDDAENEGRRKEMERLRAQEDCRREIDRVRALGAFGKALRNIDKDLAIAAETFKRVEQPPSDKVRQMLEAARNLLPSGEDETPDGQERPVAPPDPEPEGSDAAEIEIPDSERNEGTERTGAVASLGRVIERTDNLIDRLFSEANDSFEAYTPRDRCLAPVQALWMWVQSREAEMRYRIGRRREARRIWNGILQEDRTNAHALKNVAVCDTQGSDIERCLRSWCSYAEILYFYDIVAGSPRPRAGTRSDFHRAFANAYAPAFLATPLERERDWKKDIDNLSLLSFLASPGRIRSFVDHKQLQFLNAKLNFNSPPLILGVSRVNGEEVRSQAREKLLAFVEDVGHLLPDRVRKAFTGMVGRHIGQAFDACASAKRITAARDSHYQDEERRQLQLLTEFAELKYKLVVAIQESEEIAKHMVSVDFLEELARLDAIPVDTSVEFLRPVAGALGMETASVQKLIEDRLCGNVMKNLLDFIFGKDVGDGDQAQRNRQYRSLVDQWVGNPALAGFIDIIDNPQQYYPETVTKAFDDDALVSDAVEVLYGWIDRYPELTGPARYLGILLIQQEKYEEAASVLDRAIASGFHKERLVTCHHIRMIAWHHRAGIAFKKGRKNETKQALEKAGKDADLVMKMSKEEKEVEDARKVRKDVRNALGR